MISYVTIFLQLVETRSRN